MAFTLDVSGLRARVERVRAALPAAVELHVPLAATLLVEDPPYAAPMLDEVGPGPTADELLFDLGQTGTAKAIGIAIVYDWVLGEVAHAHCQKCLDYAAGGPYTADFPDRPETVDTHSSSNPCHCVWAEREPTWEQTGPEIVTTMGQDIWQDLTQAWGA